MSTNYIRPPDAAMIGVFTSQVRILLGRSAHLGREFRGRAVMAFFLLLVIIVALGTLLYLVDPNAHGEILSD